MVKEPEIKCIYTELVNPSTLKNHPKNRNKHGQDQIERLAKLYSSLGVRHPIIVSNLTNCIVSGHARKLAAIRTGIKAFPVVYQDFESIEQEYAFLQSDNAIALWAELDLSGINADILDLGPDFDIEDLGIIGFSLDAEFDAGTKDEQGKLDEKNPQIIKCPHCQHTFDKNEAQVVKA